MRGTRYSSLEKCLFSWKTRVFPIHPQKSTLPLPHPRAQRALSLVSLTGDIAQIDNPYLDASSNGLAYMIERLKGQAIAGHITLARSERSALASIAAELL